MVKDYKKLDWSDIHSFNDSILKQLNENNIKIDSILGIARGGMIPAAMISYQLDYHFDRGEIKNIYFSAGIKRSSSEFNKGFYGVEYEGDAWYVFPWDK